MKRKLGDTGAFTVTELLVAMAIMVFLGSVSLIGVPELLKSSKNRSTQALIQQVASGVKTFRKAHGAYPPLPEEMPLKVAEWGLPKGTSWYQFMNRSYAAAEERGMSKFEARGAFLELPRSRLDPEGRIIDAWLNPVRIHLDREHGIVIVSSSGADGEFGTGDDLYSH